MLRSILFIFSILATTAYSDMPHLSDTKSIAAVYLVDPEDAKSRFIGSGVFIGSKGDGAVLTAKHVANYKDRVESHVLQVTFGSMEGQRYEVFSQDCSEIVDICVLFISGAAMTNENLVPAKVSCYRPPKDRWEILAAGFTGFRGAPVLQRAGTTSIGFAVPGQHLLATEVQLIPGMSGGPIFDKFYRVIGVVYGADEASRNLGLFTPTLRAKSEINGVTANCDTEPKELADLLPVRFFPNPRLMDFRTITSPQKEPAEVWEQAPMVVSVETISYANIQEPGPKARVSNESLILKIGERRYRFAEFQRVNIGSNGKGWLGRVSNPIAVTVDDGDAVGHTTQFKPIDSITWKEFKELVSEGQPIRAELTAILSWKLQDEVQQSEISVSCDPTIEEENDAREKLLDYEAKHGKSASRLTIFCRGT